MNALTPARPCVGKSSCLSQGPMGGRKELKSREVTYKVEPEVAAAAMQLRSLSAVDRSLPGHG